MVKKRLSIDIDEDIKYEVKELAAKKRVTATELYTEWIIAGLNKEKKELDMV